MCCNTVQSLQDLQWSITNRSQQRQGLWPNSNFKPSTFPCLRLFWLENKNLCRLEFVYNVDGSARFEWEDLQFYCIGPCWIIDVPAGDWTNFSKTLIATHSVEEIITLEVALLSIVICPPARYWQLITSEFLLHTDNSPRKPCMSPLGFFAFDECASFMWMRRLNFAFQLFLLRHLNVRSYQHFYSRQSTGNTRLGHLDEIKLINPV